MRHIIADKLTNARKKMLLLNYRIVAVLMILGVAIFGIIFPDSFSDHYSLLHFSAHFGMSFLLSTFLHKIFLLNAGGRKWAPFVWVFMIVSIIGVIYKFFEIYYISHFPEVSVYNALIFSGFFTSISQNTSGILAAFSLIIYFEHIIPLRKLRANKSLVR